MLEICFEYGVAMNLSYNVLKWHLISVDKHYAKHDLPLIKLGDKLLSCVKEFKHLGCTIRAEVIWK